MWGMFGRGSCLSEVGLKISSVPATSANVERVNSSMRFQLGDHRHRLSAEKLQMLTFISFNSKIIRTANIDDQPEGDCNKSLNMVQDLRRGRNPFSWTPETVEFRPITEEIDEDNVLFEEDPDDAMPPTSLHLNVTPPEEDRIFVSAPGIDSSRPAPDKVLETAVGVGERAPLPAASSHSLAPSPLPDCSTADQQPPPQTAPDDRPPELECIPGTSSRTESTTSMQSRIGPPRVKRIRLAENVEEEESDSNDDSEIEETDLIDDNDDDESLSGDKPGAFDGEQPCADLESFVIIPVQNSKGGSKNFIGKVTAMTATTLTVKFLTKSKKRDNAFVEGEGDFSTVLKEEVIFVLRPPTIGSTSRTKGILVFSDDLEPFNLH